MCGRCPAIGRSQSAERPRGGRRRQISMNSRAARGVEGAPAARDGRGPRGPDRDDDPHTCARGSALERPFDPRPPAPARAARESARLLIVGRYRPADVIVSGHPLRALVQELRVRRQCEDIALDLLGEADVAAYLAQRFGEHAGAKAVRSGRTMDDCPQVVRNDGSVRVTWLVAGTSSTETADGGGVGGVRFRLVCERRRERCVTRGRGLTPGCARHSSDRRASPAQLHLASAAAGPYSEIRHRRSHRCGAMRSAVVRCNHESGSTRCCCQLGQHDVECDASSRW